MFASPLPGDGLHLVLTVAKFYFGIQLGNDICFHN
jgi:hypothetical protein